VFTASDSLGWCYQFWQAEKKQAVNDSGVKIGADELPAVTQLFTEDYMVDFLLDNTLGAWWAGKKLTADPSIIASAATEDDLRKAVSLAGMPWAYLRFIADEGGTWRPAAGTFDGWPKSTKDLTCLDPCMGSGHFVIAMFERLVPLRMAEEGLSETAAIQAVIRDNLYGLEIDPRCTQIGAFNLALAAWRRVGHCPLPAMHIACSGLAPNATEDEWVALAEGNSRLEEGMRRLHGLFKDAPVLGSLINPRAEGYAAFEASFAELQPILEKALASEGSDDAEHEMAVTARGVAKAAEILGRQFTLVATNVPYLGRNKQNGVLAKYAETIHSNGKADLATCFVERCLDLLSVSGQLAFVTPQNWLFLGKYKSLRKHLLSNTQWGVVVRLGEHGFSSPQAAGAFTAFVLLANRPPHGVDRIALLDVSHRPSLEEKADALLACGTTSVVQRDQLKAPDSRIGLEPTAIARTLSQHARIYQGIGTSDGPRFIALFWEGPTIAGGWTPYQVAPENDGGYSGLTSKLLWCDGGGPLVEVCQKDAQYRGRSAWGKEGVALAVTRSVNRGEYFGSHFDCTFGALIALSPEDDAAIRAFVFSEEFIPGVRAVDPSLSVTETSFGKVPFDVERWREEAARQLQSQRSPYSSDPTQWIFNGHPKDSDNPLHVAVARLVGYQWPRQTGSEFPDCPALGPDGLEAHADADGIVCLSSVRGEPTAADRLLSLLADAYGPDWSADLRDKLLAEVDAAGETLDDWLRDSFFTQHLKLFHQRPFVWHIWDGLRDGFHCLVNYHRLAGPEGEGRRTLEKIAYEYLGDWITRQKAQQASGEEGADARVAAAVHLQEQLAKIIEGEPPFEIFVRWKPLAEQPIGWDPDINDGVRLNIRPFMTARPLGAKAKKACILRAAPGIEWKKDRGTEPDRPKSQFPWFWTWDGTTQDFTGGTKFDGNRHNDLHYTRKAKEAARK
jgi:hypothetical protein